MSPAAQVFLTVVGVLVWVGLALLVAIAVGRTIREADRRECADRVVSKSCCPHEPEKAPVTVRGEFRAIVVPEPRGKHVDVKA